MDDFNAWVTGAKCSRQRRKAAKRSDTQGREMGGKERSDVRPGEDGTPALHANSKATGRQRTSLYQGEMDHRPATSQVTRSHDGLGIKIPRPPGSSGHARATSGIGPQAIERPSTEHGPATIQGDSGTSGRLRLTHMVYGSPR